MDDKYHLTRRENLFLAKKRWDESIYSGMRMENRNVTFPQTQTILEGINVAGVQLDDIQAILNMREAWRYLLDHVDNPLTISYLEDLQERVAYREALTWGELRTGTIGISGVSYVPPVPVRSDVERQLEKIMASEVSETEKALDVFAWTARSQLFWDGNKRTALLAANKVLIEAGAGILLVPEDVMVEFSNRLSDFYETGDASNLKDFLYDTCIFGIDIAQQTASPLSSEETGSPQVGSVMPSQNSDAGSKLEARTAPWLKAQRKKQGLTQKALAQAVGVATNSIANIEQGQRKGSPELWEKIESFLGGQWG